jgi:hypothetical protein
MTESDRTGYNESPDTADADSNLISGRTGDNAGDGGEQDTVLLTDDEAQRDDDPTRPGNTSD